MGNYCVYIIYSEKIDKFYIGITTDIQNRLDKHNNGFYSNSFSSCAKDWQIFHTIDCKSKHQAYRVEKHIKNSKSRTYIDNLVLYPDIQFRLLEKYK